MRIVVYCSVSTSHADCGVLGCEQKSHADCGVLGCEQIRMQIMVYWAVSKVESHADCGVLGCEHIACRLWCTGL